MTDARQWPLRVAGVVVVIALALGIVWARRTGVRGSDADPAGAPASVIGPVGSVGAVSAGRTMCDVTWPGLHSGRLSFVATNHSRSTMGVELVDLPGLRVRADIEKLAAGTFRPVTVTLGRGQYKWRCETRNGATVESPVVRITGAVLPPAHAFRPVTSLALLGAVSTLHDSTVTGVDQLVTDTDALTAAVDAGQLGPARARWLTAHLDYARLGSAYGTFGDFNDAIDGRPDGLVGGVDDPKWAGFLRLERALWTNEPQATVQPVADALDEAVHQLSTTIGTEATDPVELTIRVHEILENALQFELTGQTDQGSHTNLATVGANVEGTRTALAAVTPMLQTSDPKLLADSTAALDNVDTVLGRLRAADGSWPPLTSLSRPDRQAINGAVSHAVEVLSPIPDVLELTPDASDD